MANSTRSAKLADRIKVVVAETLKTRIKDPRLGFVTITDTRITGDLREATVFYTVFGDEEERAATAAALESAKGILRSEVGRQTGLKFTPTLAFILDAIPEGAKQIDDLLAKAAAEDARVREIAQGKTFAGEADPYRPDRSALDDEDEDGAEGAAAEPGKAAAADEADEVDDDEAAGEHAADQDSADEADEEAAGDEDER